LRGEWQAERQAALRVESLVESLVVWPGESLAVLPG
jgi:hypothetical protein